MARFIARLAQNSKRFAFNFRPMKVDADAKQVKFKLHLAAILEPNTPSMPLACFTMRSTPQRQPNSCDYFTKMRCTKPSNINAGRLPFRPSQLGRIDFLLQMPQPLRSTRIARFSNRALASSSFGLYSTHSANLKHSRRPSTDGLKNEPSDKLVLNSMRIKPFGCCAPF
jgi:hypothetical protein